VTWTDGRYRSPPLRLLCRASRWIDAALAAGQPGDEARLRELHERLSRESLYFRFFSIPKNGSREVTRLLRADRKAAFVLVGESGGCISAVASYDRDAAASDRVEVAFTI
jgi:hypothetical protein